MESKVNDRRELLSFVEFSPPQTFSKNWRSNISSKAFQRIKNATKPSSVSLQSWFSGLYPWVKTYNRISLQRDLVAALVVGTLLVPQSMSYALLTGVSPVYGLYSSIVPVIVYPIFSASPYTQFGIVAPMALVSIAIGRQYAPAGVVELTTEFAIVQNKLAFVSGLVQIFLASLRLGWISDLISAPVITGFTYGSAGLIIASQFADLLGVRYSPPEQQFGPRIYKTLENLPKANGSSCAIGIFSLLILTYAKDISIKGYKLPKLTPVPLFILILFTAISAGANLSGNNGVRIVGPIPDVLPPFHFPFQGGSSGFSEFINMLPGGILAGIVGYVQTVSMCITFAKKSKQDPNPDAELLASGMANTLGSFFSGVVCAGSFSRTAVAYDAGAVTQATSIFVGIFMILAILFLTSFLKFLPMACLAAVVMSACRSLMDPTEAISLWRGKPIEFLQMLVTFVAILVLDMQNGLFTGISFSLCLVIIRSFLPRVTELGNLPGTDTYVATDRYPEAIPIPGMLILRYDSEISFLNVRTLTKRLKIALEFHKASKIISSNESMNMFKPDGSITSSPGVTLTPVSSVNRGQHQKLKHRTVWALQAIDASETILTEGSQDDDVLQPGSLRAVILDCSRVTDVDYTGAKELSNVCDDFALENVPLVFAALPGPVRDSFQRFGVGAVEDVQGVDEVKDWPSRTTTHESVPPRNLAEIQTRSLSIAAAVKAIRDFHAIGSSKGKTTTTTTTTTTIPLNTEETENLEESISVQNVTLGDKIQEP
jgi:sulfate permease, SulP family